LPLVDYTAGTSLAVWTKASSGLRFH